MKRIDIDALNLHELYAFSRRTVTIIQSNIENDAFIQSVISLMTESLNKLSVIIGLQNNNEFTSKMAILENNRDKAFSGLLNIVEANRNHHVSAYTQTAQKIHFILEKNKLHQYSERNESFNVKLNFLLTDLRNQDLQKEIGHTEIIPWIEQLEKSQGEYLQFVKNNGADESLSLIPVIKKEKENIKRYLNGLFGYIDIYKESSQYDFNHLSDKLNGIIGGMNEVIKERFTFKEPI